MSRLLVTNKSFELLEPYEGKLSRTVLRGESSRKGADLLDIHQGDQALYPRPYNDEYNNARYANSFYVEDSDYIRLSNVRLSYDLPERWLKSLRIKALQVYIFGNNLMTWTSYSGYDPEFSSSNPLQIGRDTYRYPMKREFGAGINVKF